MARRIIFHLIFAVIGASAYYLFFDNTSVIEAIVFASVYMVFSIFFDFILDKRKSKHAKQVMTVDHKKVKAFIEAIGGVENITSTDYESARVKVVIKDVDLINQDRLKELALEGAYLSGNQLQVTIGASSSDFSRQIHEVIG